MVVAIVGLTGTSSHSSKWYSQFDGNDTGEDHALAAIGQYANNIDSVAVDKAGRGKHKWYVGKTYTRPYYDI